MPAGGVGVAGALEGDLVQRGIGGGVGGGRELWKVGGEGRGGDELGGGAGDVEGATLGKGRGGARGIVDPVQHTERRGCVGEGKGQQQEQAEAEAGEHGGGWTEERGGACSEWGLCRDRQASEGCDWAGADREQVSVNGNDT